MFINEYTDECIFKVASWWKYWWMMKRHFTTILLPYTIMVVKWRFTQGINVQFFLVWPFMVVKNVPRPCFMVVKNFKKSINSKTIPFMVRVPFLHQTNRKNFCFLRIFKNFHQIYWYPYYQLPYRKKNEIFLLPFITMFFEWLNKVRGDFKIW